MNHNQMLIGQLTILLTARACIEAGGTLETLTESIDRTIDYITSTLTPDQIDIAKGLVDIAMEEL